MSRIVIRKLFIFLLFMNASVLLGKKLEQSFFVAKKDVKNSSLSKEAIKQRMGDAVREAVHLLFDNAATLVELQGNQNLAVDLSCKLHKKIIFLEKRMTRIAESLIDDHFVFKKNHKKRLEDSLNLLQVTVKECKKATEILAARNIEQNDVHVVTKMFDDISDKLNVDACLKSI